MQDAIDFLIKGGPVMVPLLLCSILSLAATLERCIFWRRARDQEPAEEMLRLVAQHEFAWALELGRSADSPVTRVLAEALSHRNPALTKALEAAAQAERSGSTKRPQDS